MVNTFINYLAFSSKGFLLYFARINIIRVGEEVAGELQKKIANNILTSDIQTLDNRHSGKYISNIMYDAHHVQNLVSTGVLNLMKDTFSVLLLFFNVLSKLEVSFICNFNDAFSWWFSKIFR